MIRPGAVIALLMCVSFMIANITSLVRGDEQCGSCFGDVITLPVWQAITIDIFLLIAAVALLAASGRSSLALDNLLLKSDEPS
jgi:hypothetical protein